MNIKPNDLINARERFVPSKSKLEPKIDTIVSNVVGKRILMRDPRLMALIVKWKTGKTPDDMEPDNFLADPRKVEELKETFKDY